MDTASIDRAPILTLWAAVALETVVRRTLVGVVVLLASSIFSVASAQLMLPWPPWGEAWLPDEARLKVRLQAFYAAILSEDLRKMYDTETPFTRSLGTFQEYRGGTGRGLLNPETVRVNVAVERACSCTRFLYLPGQERKIGQIRCLVLVDEVQEHASGKRHSGKHIDLWEHTQGEWFYVASFWGDKCSKN
jgi:hypothetical protein